MLHKSHALRQFQILGNYIIYICFLFGIELGLFFASKCHSAISLGMHYCNHHNTIEHQINPINDISVKQSNNRFKKKTHWHIIKAAHFKNTGAPQINMQPTWYHIMFHHGLMVHRTHDFQASHFKANTTKSSFPTAKTCQRLENQVMQLNHLVFQVFQLCFLLILKNMNKSSEPLKGEVANLPPKQCFKANPYRVIQ